jgi:hypothetical protein
MFIFIVPLKSQKVSKDWNITCQLFERTLKSICNQTSRKFTVLVTCHEIPQIDFSSSQVKYLQADFSPPDPINLSKDERYFTYEVDKNRKTLMGLYFCKQLNPGFVMVVDADDCVSSHLVQYTEEHSSSNGWYFNKGYIYNQLSDRLTLIYRKFNLMCGTSNIVNYNLVGTPDKPQYNRGYGYYRDNVIFLKHDHIKNLMAEKGRPLKSLPFPGAIYITDNNENIYYDSNRPIYASKLEKFLGFRPMTSRIKDEFHLY